MTTLNYDDRTARILGTNQKPQKTVKPISLAQIFALRKERKKSDLGIARFVSDGSIHHI